MSKWRAKFTPSATTTVAVALAVLTAEVAFFSTHAADAAVIAGWIAGAGLMLARSITRFPPAAGLAARAHAALAAARQAAAAVATAAMALATVLLSLLSAAARNARPVIGTGRLARLPSLSLTPRLAARPRFALSA